jgi:capsular polysaccharide biosynthesis protein
MNKFQFIRNERSIQAEVECNHDYQGKQELKIQQVTNALVLPPTKHAGQYEKLQSGGVFDTEGKFIESSNTVRVSPLYFSENMTNWFSGKPIDINNFSNAPIVEGTTLFVGALPRAYGHFIFEGVCRLWATYKSDLEIDQVVFISNGQTKFEGHLVYYSGSNKPHWRVTQPTFFSNLLVPEASFRIHDYWHTNFLAHLKNSNGKSLGSEENGGCKIYFAKKNNNGRSFGESIIRDVFQRNGYKVIFPETLSANQLDKILFNCSVLVGSSASVIHNAVFLRPGASVICLNRSPHIHPIQVMIEQMLDVSHLYIDCFVRVKGQSFCNGPFLLGFTDELKHYFNEQKFVLPRLSARIRFALAFVLYKVACISLSFMLLKKIKAIYFRFLYAVKISSH